MPKFGQIESRTPGTSAPVFLGHFHNNDYWMVFDRRETFGFTIFRNDGSA